MSKIVKFTSDNMKALWAVKMRARNELVRGLLDEALKTEFDCTDAHFLSILRELIEEYDAIKKDIISGRIKDLPPELERLISNVYTVLTYLLQETHKEEKSISEINISTYLTRIVQFTNEIVTKYPDFAKPAAGETILEKLRRSAFVRKFLIGTAAASVIGGAVAYGTVEGKSKDDANKGIDSKTIKTEIKAEISKKDAANTKKITVEEINKAKKAAEVEKAKKAEAAKTAEIEKAKKEAEAKKLAEIAKAEEAARKANVPVPTPPGYTFMFAEETALITAYTPTGPGLMANGAPETGRTSTNFNAKNNFDGVAVDPDLIPYGSLIYIEDVGWKIADDTGAEMRHSNDERGIVHIDIRTKNMTSAINLMARIGKPLQKKIYKKVYVFKNASDKNYYNKVWDARKGFTNQDSNLFKHIKGNV